MSHYLQLDRLLPQGQMECDVYRRLDMTTIAFDYPDGFGLVLPPWADIAQCTAIAFASMDERDIEVLYWHEHDGVDEHQHVLLAVQDVVVYERHETLRKPSSIELESMLAMRQVILDSMYEYLAPPSPPAKSGIINRLHQFMNRKRGGTT